MKRILKQSLALAAISVTISVGAAWAGALVLEVGNPAANPEAKSLNAVLVARVTACHEPAKSTVTASFVQSSNGEIKRTPLKVVPLPTEGAFAVLGTVPPDALIDLAVTNPEYKNYQPRVLLRGGSQGIQWAGIRRFFSKPPTDTDIRSMLDAVD